MFKKNKIETVSKLGVKRNFPSLMMNIYEKLYVMV